MRNSKMMVWVVLVLVVLGIGGGVMWYMSVPHTAEAQFAYAEKLEKVLRGDALGKPVNEILPQVEETVEQYRRVGSRFGKSAKAAEGLKRIAKIQEEVAKDNGKALATLDDLERDYPEEENAGFGLMEQARLIRADANEMKTGNPAEAAGKYKEAVAKLEQYRKLFEKGKDADGALMEIGRIWMDGLGDPPIRAIETFEKVLKDYPQTDYRAEAMFRLAKMYQMIKEFKRAIDLYAQLLDEFPKSKWSDEAAFARGEILEKEMKDHEAAAKDFEKVQQDYPDSPFASQAGEKAKDARGEQAKQEGETYGKTRYGGSVPYDTIRDKPLPPAGMFAQFAEEKLDAQNYELAVEFIPSDNRMKVQGSLTLINRGADKTEMLLMLGGAFDISALKVDGKDAKFEHQGETLRIALPDLIKTGATSKIEFTYSGQYSDAMPTTEDLAKAMGVPQPPSGTSTAPATGPALPKFAVNPQIGLGEFGYGLSGASWYPITIIGDVFDAHIVIKAPVNDEAVSNGEMISHEKSTTLGTEGRFEFQTRTPVFGLYFAYGPYVMQEKQVGPIHFYTYLRPANASKHDAYIEVTNRILSFYAQRFVPFPYEKMAMVETPLPPFLGGVGPASLMFLHEKMVAHKDVPENLLAHELAHQWFGNMVPINIADPKYSQWLSEGFATYCDALYTEHMEGHDAFVKHIQRYDQLFFQFIMMAPRGKGAIKDTYPDSNLYRPVIYEKGALVLHMLRKVMGDDKFFQLMRDFLTTYKDKPTTVDDFRRMASTIDGEDLSWFFAEWIDQSVFVHWTIAATITGDPKTGEPVRVSMEIDQPDDLVKMPADITLLGAAGERLVMANVMLDKKEQKVETTTPFKPVKIIVDEDNWVLRHPGSDNVWSVEKAAKAE